MATLTIPHAFVAGTPALASEVNANFQAIIDWTNSNITTENIGLLTARPSVAALPSSPTLAILSLVQTTSQPALHISNQGSDNPVTINQSGVFATGKGAIVINDPTLQTTPGSSHILVNLASGSTIPAIEINYGSTNAFKVNSNSVKLPVKTTAQRDAIIAPEEGSILYNSDTEQLNIRTSSTWSNGGSAAIPIGSVQMFAGTTAPGGWLLCQGQAVSQSTYSALFAVISTAYNNGTEPGGTFRLPDLRGISPIGSGTNANPTLVASGKTYNGGSVGNYLVDTMGSHDHIIEAFVTSSNPGPITGQSVAYQSYNSGSSPWNQSAVTPYSSIFFKIAAVPAAQNGANGALYNSASAFTTKGLTSGVPVGTPVKPATVTMQYIIKY